MFISRKKTENFMKADFKFKSKKRKQIKKPRMILGQHYQFTQKKVFLFSSGLLQSKNILAR